MPYEFTDDEQIEITAAFNSGPNPGQPGNFSTFYITVRDILVDDSNGPPPDSDPAVLASRFWFDGAIPANAGLEPYSTLIREYTQTFGGLVTGSRFAENLLQETSNNVARAVFGTITPAWILPALSEIADEDANAIGLTLYNSTPLDTTFTHNSGWAGTVLVPLLGSDETDLLISTGLSPLEADSLDDFRNIQYAVESVREGRKDAALDAIWSLGRSILGAETSEVIRAAETAVEVCVTFGNCLPFLQFMTSDTVAEAGFQQVYQYGQTGLVSLLDSAFVGTVTLHSGDSDFKVLGPALYGEPGDQNHDVHVIARSSSELLDTAQSGSQAARKSLEALSPFEISGGITPAPDPSLADLEDEYLIARAGMLVAHLAYLDAGVAPGPGTSVQSSQVVSAVRYSDLSSGIEYTVKPGLFLFSTPREVVFGSSGSDILSGGGKSDELFGQEGDDQLISTEGADILVGGQGNDSYVVTSNGVRILDVDGLGAVTFNSAQLIGGNQAGGSVWVSADQRFRFYLVDSGGSQQLQVIDTSQAGNSLFIDNFTDGDLGITLVGSGNPMPPTDVVAPIDNGDRRDMYFGSGTLSHLIDAGPQRDFCELGSGADVVLLGTLNDRCLAGFGNDTVLGEEGLDYLVGGPLTGDLSDAENDNDVLEGGADTDLLNGGVGDDVLFAETSLDDPNRDTDDLQGDLLNGALVLTC